MSRVIRPVWSRSLLMSIARSPAVPSIMGSIVFWPFQLSSACSFIGVVSPNASGNWIDSHLSGLDRGQGDGIDNVIDQGASGKVIHRASQPLEHGSDADHVTAALNRLVSGIPGVQVGKDKDGCAPGDRAIRRFGFRNVRHKRGIVLERTVDQEIWPVRLRKL